LFLIPTVAFVYLLDLVFKLDFSYKLTQFIFKTNGLKAIIFHKIHLIVCRTSYLRLEAPYSSPQLNKEATA